MNKEEELMKLRKCIEELAESNTRDIERHSSDYRRMVHSPFVEKHTLGVLAGKVESLSVQNTYLMDILGGLWTSPADTRK